MAATAVVSPRVSAPWTGKLFSNGWRQGSAGVLEVIGPATGEILLSVGAASPADVHTAAVIAASAQPAWAALPARDRAELFRKVARVFERVAEQIPR